MIERRMYFGNLGQRSTISRSSAEASDLQCSKFRSTHMAHFLCKELFECCSEVVMVLSKMASCWFSQVSVFARICTGFVVFLLWFCKGLCFCLAGVRIPPPPLCLIPLSTTSSRVQACDKHFILTLILSPPGDAVAAARSWLSVKLQEIISKYSITADPRNSVPA